MHFTSHALFGSARPSSLPLTFVALSLCSSIALLTGDAWWKILEHVRRRHKIQHSELKTTFLYEAGRAELNQKQQARRQEALRKKQDAESLVVAGDVVATTCAAPTRAAQAPPASSESVVVAPDSVVVVAETRQAIQADSGAEASPPLQARREVRSPKQMLAEVHAWMREMHPEKDKWLHELPAVQLKSGYVHHRGPAAKGEGDKNRAVWPSTFSADVVKLPAFRQYLEQDQNKKTYNTGTTVLNVGRVLGALKIKGRCEDGLADVKVLVALYTSRAYQQLIDLPLLSPRYSWSMRMMDGLVLYCQFHLRCLAQKLIRSQQGPWAEYSNVLTTFAKDLKGGHRKRCQEQREENIKKKGAQDLDSLRNLPSVPDLQHGVRDAYLCLRVLAKAFADRDAMTPRARGAANAAVAGAIALDTFAGRKMEWENLRFAYAKEVLMTNNSDHVLCSQHKTAKTYGEVAKWLSPGLRSALQVYATLPRPEGIETLLVPVTCGATVVPLHSCLRVFARRYLPASRAMPTFNLMRKMFHTALMDLSDTEDKLQELMKIVDAHSKEVQRKHYCLKKPRVEVKLAQALVHAVLGGTVPWPADEEAGPWVLGRLARTQ